ncbi:hypothetical protein BST63_02125 [Bradyrhizobium canariense]|uniref:Uncharacterized protein n=1 Tax=Bradyrhizobium canariense TaxID=255045 RepID=A0ABX3XBY9_9BRAD|nr:hypothetical protein BSR47_02350 [Bradyrhizobium canariense]OSJ35366.1 hypothetical protein BST63_02125 [Bradyrhizobium canariense]
MLHRIPSLIIAIIMSVSVLALAQAGGAVAGSAGAGTGTGTGSANTGGSAPSGMGTNASSANPGPSAPPGMGTRDVGAGANLDRTSQTNSPDVQPATSKSRAAAQAKRNAGAGHAQNGLPIGAIGTGTSNEEQMIVGPSPNRKIPAAKVDGDIAGIVGRGSSLSDQVSRPRASRAGEKVLDAKAQVQRRTTVSHKRIPDPENRTR